MKTRPNTSRFVSASRSVGSAFTLVELMVVIVLMSLLVGTTVIGLPPISEESRLQAAGHQWASIDRLARTQAEAMGVPWLITAEIDSNRCRLKNLLRPNKLAEQTGVFRLPGRTRIVSLVTEQPETGADLMQSPTVRIQADATSANYAVELATMKRRGAVVMNGLLAIAEFRVHDQTSTPIGQILREADQRCACVLDEW